MRKLNHKQQLFADFILEGKSQIEAHRLAGYSGKNDNARAMSASGIIRNHNVVKYLEEMRAKASQSAEVTLEWLIEQACEVMLAAKAEGAHAAATGAIKELGVLTGLRVEKRDNTNRIVKDASDLTEAEILAYIQEGSGEGIAEAETRPAGPDQLH